MARRKVSVNPMQKTLGEDYIDDETMGKLAYLNPDQNINLSGAAQPQVSSNQRFQDVPRQVSIREDVEEEFDPEYVSEATNNFIIPSNDDDVTDLQGLDLLGQIAQNEAYEDSLDAVAETDPPEQYLAPLERFMTVLDDETRGDIFGAGEQMEQEQPVMMEEPEMDIQDQPIQDVDGVQKVPPDEPLNMIMDIFQQKPELKMLLPQETRRLLDEGTREELGVRVQDVQDMLKPYMGAVEVAINNPEMLEFLRVADGLSRPYDKETLEDAIDLSNMFNKREEDRTEREEELAESLKSGTLTTQEMVALGIATVVPALLALFYGKEAALGAIAGGLKGSAEFMSKNQPDKSSIRKELKEISDERKKDRSDHIDLKKKLLDNVKSPKLRRFFENRNVQAFEADDTIGIPVDEKYNLFLDMRKIKNDGDFEKWDKDVKKDKEALAIQNDVNESLEQVQDLLEELKKQNPSLYTTFIDNFKGYVPKSWRDLTPEGLKFLKTEPIKILVNGELREVDPVRQLEQLLAKFQTAYIKMNNMDNRLTNNVKDHLSDVLPNPGSFIQWFSQDVEDFIEKVNTLRNESNRRFVTQAELNGYVGSPLKAMFPYGSYQVIDEDAIQRGFRGVLSEPEKYADKVVR